MKRIKGNRLTKAFKDYMFLTFKEFVYVVILTAFFTLISFIIHVRAEPGARPGFVVVYFGFPLEWYKINANLGSWYSSLTRTEILWAGLAVDVTMFVLLSIALVRVGDKVAEHMPSELFKL